MNNISYEKGSRYIDPNIGGQVPRGSKLPPPPPSPSTSKSK